MSQTGQEYVCNNAVCRCDKGTLPSMLKVLANQTVYLQGKTVATTLDKLFMPFGTCAMKYNTPCVPMLLMWQDYFDKVSLVAPGCHPLLEKSTIKCALGGTVSIMSTLQISVPLPPPPPQAEGVRTASMSLCPLLFNASPSA
jgi:glycine cleavage system protein P-like pyridoxal-binding family